MKRLLEHIKWKSIALKKTGLASNKAAVNKVDILIIATESDSE